MDLSPQFQAVSGSGRIPFIFEGTLSRVVFGVGTKSRVSEEAERLKIDRALVISSAAQASDAYNLAGTMGSRCNAVFAGAEMHTPTAITDRAMEIVRRNKIDGLIALGGGSAIGLSKALSLRTHLPQLAVPTTYAGSEMTSILGETRDGIKTTLRDNRLLPSAVIYDVQLTVGLSSRMSAASGLNALAHAVEALYAPEINPIIALFAQEGIGALATSLPVLVSRPQDMSARENALYGAWLCGMCLGAVSMSLHHKLCHVLGGTFDLPHAETHAIVLPHAVAYNTPAAASAMEAVARALNAPNAACGLFDLLLQLDIPVSLSEIGMPASGIDDATELALRNAYANPRPLEFQAVRELIARAYRGDRPVDL